MSELRPEEEHALHVRKVHSLRTLKWLALGWDDFMDAPLIGLAHGTVMAAFGGLLLWLAWDKFWVLAGAFSAFLLVAPIMSTGLYAASRELTHDRTPTFATVWKVWSSLDGRLVRLGGLLGFLGLAWVMTSAALITLGVKPPVTTPSDFLHRVVLAREPGIFEIWLIMGGIMAAPVLATSLVAIPLLLDRQVSVHKAVYTSFRSVMANPICTSLWGGIVMSLCLLGLGTLMFGLILVIPVLGHATWHAYRDLVVREAR
jgi:uncharacterized membrane protein